MRVSFHDYLISKNSLRETGWIALRKVIIIQMFPVGVSRVGYIHELSLGETWNASPGFLLTAVPRAAGVKRACGTRTGAVSTALTPRDWGSTYTSWSTMTVYRSMRHFSFNRFCK